MANPSLSPRYEVAVLCIKRISGSFSGSYISPSSPESLPLSLSPPLESLFPAFVHRKTGMQSRSFLYLFTDPPGLVLDSSVARSSLNGLDGDTRRSTYASNSPYIDDTIYASACSTPTFGHRQASKIYIYAFACPFNVWASANIES